MLYKTLAFTFNATASAALILFAIFTANQANASDKDSIGDLIRSLSSDQTAKVDSGNITSAFAIDPNEAKQNEDTCMQLNLYHEARGEPIEGILAVMEVTKARVRDPGFPNSVCAVVWQKNQFEWTNDAKSDYQITDVKGWNRINDAIIGNQIDWDQRVTYFHSGSKPSWFAKANLVEVSRIGNHIFYREP